jgi:hypothetical protein
MLKEENKLIVEQLNVAMKALQEIDLVKVR